MKWCGRIYSVLIIYCLLIYTLNFCISSCPQKKKKLLHQQLIWQNESMQWGVASACWFACGSPVTALLVGAARLPNFFGKHEPVVSAPISIASRKRRPYPIPSMAACNWFLMTDWLDVVEWYREGSGWEAKHSVSNRIVSVGSVGVTMHATAMPFGWIMEGL